jgi:hypothetical protein
MRSLEDVRAPGRLRYSLQYGQGARAGCDRTRLPAGTPIRTAERPERWPGEQPETPWAANATSGSRGEQVIPAIARPAPSRQTRAMQLRALACRTASRSRGPSCARTGLNGPADRRGAQGSKRETGLSARPRAAFSKQLPARGQDCLDFLAEYPRPTSRRPRPCEGVAGARATSSRRCRCSSRGRTALDGDRSQEGRRRQPDHAGRDECAPLEVQPMDDLSRR